MRETRADTAQAIVWALLLHAALFALMFLGLQWVRTNAPVSAAGSPVAAELVDANALTPAMQSTLRKRPKPVDETQPQPQPEEAAPLPQPLPEPVPEEAPTPPQAEPQDFIPVPDARNQEAVVDQPTPTPATEDKVQEEKRRQEQIDLTERERQQEVERKQRLAQMEAERLKQLEDIRKQRAKASREAQLAEQRLQQIADARAVQSSTASASASAPPGNNGTDTGLQARYITAIQEAVLSKWTRPETVPLGSRCRIIIRQLQGGTVISADVTSPCDYDEAGRRSIEAAVLKAQPLPYAGFETVFNRQLNINFTAQDR